MQQDKARFTGSLSSLPPLIDINHKNSDGAMKSRYVVNNDAIDGLFRDSKKDLEDYNRVDSTTLDKMVRLYNTDKIPNVQRQITIDLSLTKFLRVVDSHKLDLLWKDLDYRICIKLMFSTHLLNAFTVS